LFPSYSLKFLPKNLGLYNSETKEMKFIDEDNFGLLQSYLKDIICLSKEEGDYNPQDAKAKEIAEKLRRGR